MTGEEAWQLLQEFTTRFVAPVHPYDRHKYTGKVLYAGAEWIRQNRPEIWEDFRDARARSNYHR